MSIDYETEGHIVIIRLNNPNKLNAYTTEMLDQLRAAWTRFRADNQARVAILTGAGEKSFTAGADLKEAAERPDGWYREAWWNDQDYGLGMAPEEGMSLWKPTIAAVNGYCIGGGMTFILGCDIRICSENATFSFPEVRVGMAGVTGAMLLPRIIPLGWAAQMALTGDSITAEEALRCGLVNAMYPQADLMAQAHRLADRIARNAPLAVRVTKEAMYRAIDMPINQALVLGEWMRRVIWDTDDSIEGPRAFAEKRTPIFKGT